jgi:hypothetical protein
VHPSLYIFSLTLSKTEDLHFIHSTIELELNQQNNDGSKETIDSTRIESTKQWCKQRNAVRLYDLSETRVATVVVERGEGRFHADGAIG